MTRSPVLEVEGLGKIWDDGKRRIDIAIDRLTVSPGDFKAIVGPSGSGKSTALDLLALVRRPDRAESFRLSVSCEGETEEIRREVLKSRGDRLCDLRRRTYAYVVQTSEMMPFLRLEEDFALQQSISGTGSLDLARAMAEALDIGDCLGLFPGELSVGQRQRAAVVRAAAAMPRILLADEPTSALDPDLKTAVLTALKDTAARGTAVLMVTHDVDLIQRHGLDVVGVETERTTAGWKTVFTDEAA